MWGDRIGKLLFKVDAEPGAAPVTFLPKMTEHPEPGGMN
jgi:hypothetical protein